MHSVCHSNGRMQTYCHGQRKGDKADYRKYCCILLLAKQAQSMPVFSSNISLCKSYIYTLTRENVVFVKYALPQTWFWSMFTSGKCREQHRDLYIDLAFKTVDQHMLWHILAKWICSPKIVAIIKAIHTDIYAHVVSAGIIPVLMHLKSMKEWSKVVF